MFEKYVEQVLNIFRYVDSVLITDKKGDVKYYHTNRVDLNMLNKSNIVGKNILELYINLSEENSTILQVLKSGKPILNYKQELFTVNGVLVDAITSTLPIKEDEKIIGTIDVSSYAIETMTVTGKKAKAKEELYQLSDIVSVDSVMSELKENIKKVANTSSAVMIYGETGTGKELVAQSIHTAGERKNRRFISQNCAAIPATLMESILFGTKKGSFTGAEDSPGLFELADGGTLFLDEINSMEMSIQSKLLKAVEEKEITRIGGTSSIFVDVKIVTATNEKIDHIFESGSVRKDLLYRLSTVRLDIPPLRERIVDIAPLAKHFIRAFNYDMNRNMIDLTEEVYDIFTAYSWPGNVRELRNIIEGAFNLSAGRFVEKKDLPPYLETNAYVSHSNYKSACEKGLRATMEQIEKEIIVNVLNQCGSRAEAARKLKLSKQAFQYKLEKYSLEELL